MSDFEARLGAALADGAEKAPGAGGLATAARRRAASRRRRRVVAGAAIAVAVAAVPVGVLAADRSDDPDRPPSVADPTPSATEWRTVSDFEVSVDLPADWVELGGSTCADVPGGWGPAGTDPCQPVVRAVPPSKLSWTSDAPTPGLATGTTSGFVQVGAVVVFVSDREGLEHDTARRVLASARPEGEPAPDVVEWETVPVLDGVVADRPVGPNVEVTYDAAQSACLPSPAMKIDGVWVATRCPSGRVVVTAPTHALADVVASSVRQGTVDGWTTVDHQGIAVDVPPGWSRLDCPEEIAVFAPVDAPCDAVATGSVVILGPTISSSVLSWEVGSESGSVDLYALGGVRAGDLPAATVRRVLASARPTGTPAPEVAEWETFEAGRGFVVDVPVGDAVSVSATAGTFDCRVEPLGSRQQATGGWGDGFCAGQYLFSVDGPTQALTDIVSLSIRPAS